LVHIPTGDFDVLYNRDNMSGLDQNNIDAISRLAIIKEFNKGQQGSTKFKEFFKI
jgi:hypothetical protein